LVAGSLAVMKLTEVASSSAVKSPEYGVFVFMGTFGCCDFLAHKLLLQVQQKFVMPV
jgi:hypothetical protein